MKQNRKVILITGAATGIGSSIAKSYINEGHKLSLQYHEKKEETILVVSGTLEITVGGHGRRGISTLKLSEGDTYHVTPGTIHRFAATCGTNVVLTEVSTNYLDDVVRLEDDYDRE